MRLLRRYAPRNDNDKMSLPAKRSNLNDCTEQDHFILLEALSERWQGQAQDCDNEQSKLGDGLR
ncbi:MAG: hypothetical protein ACE5NM_09110 [Sedimentisphaerales bacterium]